MSGSRRSPTQPEEIPLDQVHRSLPAYKNGTHDAGLGSYRPERPTVMKECAEIVRLLAKHAVYMLLLTIRLSLLPMCRIVRWLSAVYTSSRGLTEPIPPPEASLHRQTILLMRYTPRQVITRSCRQIFELLSRPVRTWRRIDRALTKLEGLELTLLQTPNFPRATDSFMPNDSSVSSTVPQDSPFLAPASASQIYHAALIDNKTLDDLLSSFDGARALRISEQAASLHDFGQQTAQLGSDKTHGVEAVNAWAGQSGRESVEYDERPVLELNVPPQAGEELPSSGEFSRTLDHVSEGDTTKAAPDAVQCTACERRQSSDSMRSVMETPRVRPPFSTSIESFHTIPKTKRSHIPRRAR